LLFNGSSQLSLDAKAEPVANVIAVRARVTRNFFIDYLLVIRCFPVCNMHATFGRNPLVQGVEPAFTGCQRC
jgi:hypothetical protein